VMADTTLDGDVSSSESLRVLCHGVVDTPASSAWNTRPLSRIVDCTRQHIGPQQSTSRQELRHPQHNAVHAMSTVRRRRGAASGAVTPLHRRCSGGSQQSHAGAAPTSMCDTMSEARCCQSAMNDFSASAVRSTSPSSVSARDDSCCFSDATLHGFYRPATTVRHDRDR
jgi:hypothetical protein